MGANQSNTNSPDTINWNDINTSNYKRDLNSLSTEAKQLIISLNLPELTDTPNSESSIGNIISKINKTANDSSIINLNNVLNTDNKLSETSQFMDSEMVNFLNKEQAGGSKNIRKLNIADSATTTTSSDDSATNSDGDDDDNNSPVERTIDNLSYISSSIHSGGDSEADESDLDDSEADESEADESEIDDSEADESEADESDDNEKPRNNKKHERDESEKSISVHTSDINMLSDSD